MLKWLILLYLNRWPRSIPRYYPGVPNAELAKFMTRREFERICRFRCVYVLPFTSEQGSQAQKAFGAGLSHVLIRNLMLLRDVSIHGPEDTPLISCEAARNVARELRRLYVTGVAEARDSGFRLDFEVLDGARGLATGRVRERSLPDFLRVCTESIAKAIGSDGKCGVEAGWEIGQPADPGTLVRYGTALLGIDRNQQEERRDAALALFEEDNDFRVPAWLINSDLRDARRWYLKSLERDPYNAQLFFETFCAVWRGFGTQPPALQFCRMAIELSPGHGKAHMCTPHTAEPDEHLLLHSELGYRLLQGNSFAVSNYLSYLQQYGAPREKLVELAREGLEADPRNPNGYYQLIELFAGAHEFDLALKIARKLLTLFEPEIDERAAYCLRQNPERAREIDNGEFDPVAETRALIKKLRAARDAQAAES